MNCNCIQEINTLLREQNVELDCEELIVRVGSISVGISLRTKWVDPDSAPRGRKRSCPPMFASHCPFCGVKIREEVAEEVNTEAV